MFKNSPSLPSGVPGSSFVNSPSATGGSGILHQPDIMGMGAGGQSQGLESRPLASLPIAQQLQPNLTNGPRPGMPSSPGLLRLILALRSRGGV